MTIGTPDAAKLYDTDLRWEVVSRTDPHVKYVVELDSYRGNGECACDDFNLNLRKFLARGLTGEQAVEQGLVKVRKWQRVPANALRCWHIMDAREGGIDAVIRTLVKLRR